MNDIEKIKYWADFWDRIEHWSFFIVVIALAVEFAASRFGAPHRRKLEEANERLVADANAQAEHAKTTAESFRRDIATANEHAAEAQKKAAEFNEIAERERLARVRLEAKLLPRSIGTGQELQLVEHLSQFAGTKVDIIRTADSAEITAFASKVGSVLGQAGWQVRGIWSTMGGVSATGIVVDLPPELVRFSVINPGG